MISVSFAAVMGIGMASGGLIGYSTGHPRLADAGRPPGTVPQGTACSPQGPDGEPLIGLGATIGVFRASFGPQSTYRPYDFGELLSGGPNQGARQFAATCAPNGHVLTMTWNLPTALSVTGVKVNILLSGLVPPDSMEVRDVHHSPSCELLMFRSLTLAKEMGDIDPSGVIAAEMTSPSNAPFDRNAVTSVLLSMNEAANC